MRILDCWDSFTVVFDYTTFFVGFAMNRKETKYECEENYAEIIQWIKILFCNIKIAVRTKRVRFNNEKYRINVLFYFPLRFAYNISKKLVKLSHLLVIRNRCYESLYKHMIFFTAHTTNDTISRTYILHLK